MLLTVTPIFKAAWRAEWSSVHEIAFPLSQRCLSGQRPSWACWGLAFISGMVNNIGLYCLADAHHQVTRPLSLRDSRTVDLLSLPCCHHAPVLLESPSFGTGAWLEITGRPCGSQESGARAVSISLTHCSDEGQSPACPSRALAREASLRKGEGNPVNRIPLCSPRCLG